MPHVSKKLLDLTTQKQITDTFELVLAKMNKDETNAFLFSLLSETERLMLAKRLAIAVMIRSGVEQDSIVEALCITKETVNRTDLSLLKRTKGFEIAFKKISEDKIMQEIKNRLLKLASYSIKAAGGRVDFPK